jgi:hypothetical protein
LLYGVIKNSDDVEGIHVMNLNSKAFAVSDATGTFVMRAKANDTLSIISIRYIEKIIPITAEILESRAIEISLIDAINQLGEVVVGNTLTGDLNEDMAAVSILEYLQFTYDWNQVSNVKYADDRLPVRNIITTEDQFVNGIDFVAIIAGVVGLLVKPKKKGVYNETQKEAFDLDYIKNNFGVMAFSESFKIKEEYAGLFVQYCQEDVNLMKDFRNNNDLGLFEGLVKKSKEFKLLSNEE